MGSCKLAFIGFLETSPEVLEQLLLIHFKSTFLLYQIVNIQHSFYTKVHSTFLLFQVNIPYHSIPSPYHSIPSQHSLPFYSILFQFLTILFQVNIPYHNLPFNIPSIPSQHSFYTKLPTNCLSAFDHFVGLALEGLKVH